MNRLFLNLVGLFAVSTAFFPNDIFACPSNHLHISITNATKQEIYLERGSKDETYSAPFSDMVSLMADHKSLGYICFAMISGWGGYYTLNFYKDAKKLEEYGPLVYSNANFSSDNPSVEGVYMAASDNGDCHGARPKDCEVSIKITGLPALDAKKSRYKGR